LVDFLKGSQTETAQFIQRLEEKKREAEGKIQEGQTQLEDSKTRLEQIAERYVSDGRQRKEQIIEDAKTESRLLLEAAQARIANQIQEANRTIRAELIEAAVEKAMVKLPKMITDKDNERMIALWMEEAQQ
jgi:F0F1-type ATP synthase membrane subunit b/b'